VNKTLKLADTLDFMGTSPNALQAAASELRRLDMMVSALQRLAESDGKALDEWLRKTDWLDVKVGELGLHKADVLRMRIELANELLKQSLEALHCAEHDNKIDVAIRALKNYFGAQK